jgi:hypothetical protein
MYKSKTLLAFVGGADRYFQAYDVRDGKHGIG